MCFAGVPAGIFGFQITLKHVQEGRLGHTWIVPYSSLLEACFVYLARICFPRGFEAYTFSHYLAGGVLCERCSMAFGTALLLCTCCILTGFAQDP